MPKRILLVEDDHDNVVLFTHVLERLLGQQVIVAKNGHEAIRMAHQHKPDLILMDLTLPHLSGWETTRSLKKTAQFRDTPILALTAHAMVGDRERALEAGCDDYFSKPIEVDTFVAFLKPYLQEEDSDAQD